MGEGFRFELEESENYLKLTFYGAAKLEDCKNVVRTASKDGVFLSARRLYDLSECRLELSSDDVRVLADFGKPYDPSPSRAAFVASRNLNFGIARMHEVFRQHTGFSSKVFRDEDDAISWLIS